MGPPSGTLTGVREACRMNSPARRCHRLVVLSTRPHGGIPTGPRMAAHAQSLGVRIFFVISAVLSQPCCSRSRGTGEISLLRVHRRHPRAVRGRMDHPAPRRSRARATYTMNYNYPAAWRSGPLVALDRGAFYVLCRPCWSWRGQAAPARRGGGGVVYPPRRIAMCYGWPVRDDMAGHFQMGRLPGRRMSPRWLLQLLAGRGGYSLLTSRWFVLSRFIVLVTHELHGARGRSCGADDHAHRHRACGGTRLERSPPSLLNTKLLL